jgi:hypothetical protein
MNLSSTNGRIGADLDLGFVLEADHRRGGAGSPDGLVSEDIVIEDEIFGAGRSDAKPGGAVEVPLHDIADLLIGQSSRRRQHYYCYTAVPSYAQ